MRKESAKTALSGVGRFRVYYNREGAYPQVWCVSPTEGTCYSGVRWEIAVCQVTLFVPASAVFVPKDTDDRDDGKPSAWFEVFGRLSIDDDGNATVTDHTKESK